MEPPSPLRPHRQDTFDLHEAIVSDPDERDGDYADDDDRSSSLSIPNESIDFDLVYSLHSFAATVEGQASVVKGDSLVLMDDSNSYWWLVRVLKTQEVGYIPAENIETPYERLARLNKHRNVDVRRLPSPVSSLPHTHNAPPQLAAPTPEEHVAEDTHPHPRTHPHANANGNADANRRS